MGPEAPRPHPSRRRLRRLLRMREARSRLRAVVALDDDDIGRRMRLPHLDVGLVFRRIVAGERGGVVGKLDHHVARARRALRTLEFARAHDIARAELLEDGRIGLRIGLVALVIAHVDAADPVALGHSVPPYFLAACSISATIASAAAFGSWASTTGRPTTR